MFDHNLLMKNRPNSLNSLLEANNHAKQQDMAILVHLSYTQSSALVKQ